MTVGLVIALASAATGLAQPLATKAVMDALADDRSLTGPVRRAARLDDGRRPEPAAERPGPRERARGARVIARAEAPQPAVVSVIALR